MHTPDADYFRHQAATCLRLAQFCRDLEVARRLFGMAGEFKSKAAEMDADLQTMTVPSIAPSAGRRAIRQRVDRRGDVMSMECRFRTDAAPMRVMAASGQPGSIGEFSVGLLQQS
jgi:hypothetical protein